ncbi:MAG TPA: EscU/YscU/HrcU family type III secretion system export apparatus switch protein [Terriglobales bacterium]|nr:EscU/YscU/HrcU family type III secretion system export apparatus switch protein [Terriglobales bacterium]
MADANKTEPGTAHKKQEARKEGQIARGRDLPGAAAILASVAAMTWFSGHGVSEWRTLMAQMLEAATRPGAQIGLAQFQATILLALEWTAVVAAAAWACCTAFAFQGGFLFAPKMLLRFDRLQPGQNLKNMVSASSLSRTARSVVPVGAMAYLTFALLAQNWSLLMASSEMPVPLALGWLTQIMMSMAWRCALVLVAWSGIDYMLQRRSHETSMRMTKQEIKDEGKELQGSPETRGRIRRLQRQMHRRRMMQQVALASVVITNPTEYAVALRYDAATMAAPVVVAKGRLLLAARIRARAVSAGVPIVENRLVARTLYRHVEIGTPIPGKLYAAVAEILAFIHRTYRNQAQPASPGLRPMLP